MVTGRMVPHGCLARCRGYHARLCGYHDVSLRRGIRVPHHAVELIRVADFTVTYAVTASIPEALGFHGVPALR